LHIPHHDVVRCLLLVFCKIANFYTTDKNKIKIHEGQADFHEFTLQSLQQGYPKTQESFFSSQTELLLFSSAIVCGSWGLVPRRAKGRSVATATKEALVTVAMVE